METIPVFRNGTWISYSVPSPIDPYWTQAHKLQAASFYATAKQLNISAPDVLTEMYINKLVYPKLAYDEKYERKIQQVMSHAETA
jgi:hypothetical protein